MKGISLTISVMLILMLMLIEVIGFTPFHMKSSRDMGISSSSSSSSSGRFCRPGIRIGYSRSSSYGCSGISNSGNGVLKSCWVFLPQSPTNLFKLFMSFDEDFANAMSKPLPDWYAEQQEAREQYEKELEEYRQKIATEFRRKFDDSKDRCMVVYDKDGNIVNTGGSNVVNAFRREKSENLISNRFGADPEASDEDVEEEKATGFYLPGEFIF